MSSIRSVTLTNVKYTIFWGQSQVKDHFFTIFVPKPARIHKKSGDSDNQPRPPSEGGTSGSARRLREVNPLLP